MKKFLLFFGIFINAFAIHAQVSLGISHIIYFYPDTVNHGDSINYTAFVKNYGPSTFNGDIKVHTAVLDTANGSLNIVGIDTTLYNTANLSANDSVSVYINGVCDSTNYRKGNNIVVIWPSAVNATTRDSVHDTVYVRELSSVKTIIVSKHLKLYPNPVNNIGYIHEENYQNTFETIIITDQVGRIVKTIKYSEFIDFTGMQSGIYYLAISSKSLTTVLKVIKID
jgi:hypothetical protein